MKTLFALCVALSLAALSAPIFAANANSHSFEKTVPAAGISRLDLEGSVGEVHIKAADTDTIKVKAEAKPGNHIHFIFDWTVGNKPAGQLPEGLHLVMASANGTLTPCLTVVPGNSGCSAELAASSSSAQHSTSVTIGPLGNVRVNNSNHSWKADWTIVVPAHLAVKLKLNVGSAEVQGIAGGLSAKINVGHLNATLPRGPIDAKVDVGHIDAKVGSADYGPVKLQSNIGDTTFSVHGRHIATPQKQTLHGSGETSYTLTTNIGHIGLELGVAGLSKMPPVKTPVTSTSPAPTTTAAPASVAVPTTAPVAASNAG